VREMWVGLDLGSPKRITRIAYAGRSGFEHRTAGAKFQGSNSPTFSTGVVDLYTIPTAAERGRMMTVDIKAPGAYRYVRYIGGTEHGNVAEIQFSGEAAAGAVLSPSAGAALSGSVANIEGKSFDLSAQAKDWIHWGHARQTNRKAGSQRCIGDLTGESMFFVDNHARYSWTDGSPLAKVDNTIEAVFRSSSAPPFRFTVRPGDTRVHTLTVYLGGVTSTGDFTASLPGAAAYVDRGRGNLSEHYYFAYTIQFHAAKPTDEMTIEWKQTTGTGNIQLHAAALR